MAERAYRQLRDAPHSLADGELADGQTERRGDPRLRHYVQSIPSRDHQSSPTIRRAASLYSRFGIVVWSVDLRDSHSQRQPPAGNIALRDFANISRDFRSADDSIPPALSFPSVAFLWQFRRSRHCLRIDHCFVAGDREAD